MSAHVLMVDDEQDITTVVSRGLEQRGFKVTTFNNPVEALNHYKPRGFDIILLDIRMPHMTGFALARAIWKMEEAAAVFPTLRTPCFLRIPIGLDQLAKHIHTQLGSDAADLTTIN